MIGVLIHGIVSFVGCLVMGVLFYSDQQYKMSVFCWFFGGAAFGMTFCFGLLNLL